MIIINTSKGDIHIELDEKTTPKTAANFLTYVRDGFYTDTIFHRVIDGFMIQGGGLTEALENKATNDPVENEAHGDNPNKRGTIAMARTSAPHSATSQFFINLVDNDFLNNRQEKVGADGYCVFGKVTEGMDVVDAIAKIKTSHSRGYDDVPTESIVIHSITEVKKAKGKK